MDAPGDRFYFFRLLPPRATFRQDMTPEERTAMTAHVGYWTEQLNAGRAIVFGPVDDPNGPWGLGVVRAPDDDHMRWLTENDPVILAGLGFRFEVLPMVRAIVKT